MSGYRVRVEGISTDPLAVDPTLAARHAARKLLVQHVFLTFVTMGLWLPGLIVVWLTREARAAKATAGYSVRVVEGQLRVGTREEHTLVPLERIQTLSTQSGLVTVQLDGRSSVVISGLADPLAAAQAILEARDAKISAERGASLPALEQAEGPSTHAPGRHAR